MAWSTFHNRGATLRAVVAAAELRRDGRLPMDVEGVAETFRDELDLLAALALKWHTRLSGQIERMQAGQPMDLGESVAVAWSNTAHELAGVRLALDHYRANPLDEAMAQMMAVATDKEHQLLAVMAGRAGLGDRAASRIGAEIEEGARALHQALPPLTPEAHAELAESAPRPGLLERLRAVLAA